MANTLITIERQFASGGITIGKKLSERLGIPCYSNEILDQAAKNCSIPQEYVESTQEDVSQSLINRLSYVARTGNSPDAASTRANNLYKEISRIINEMADKGSCIIIGRCSDYILKDREHCLNVFIHAGIESRIQRAINEYGIDEDMADYIIHKNDKRRESFYNACTGRTWGVKDNYHICLSSDKFGTDNCVEMILHALDYIK